jgi:hypothetical protein
MADEEDEDAEGLDEYVIYHFCVCTTSDIL